MKRPRVAVLVDSDQHHRSLRGIRVAAEREGEIVVAEAYARWDDPDRRVWREFTDRSRFRMVTPAIAGKDAADKAIMERVAELLKADEADAFWIATSDRDFVKAAENIKAKGKSVTLILATAHFPPSLQSSLRIVDPWPTFPPDWREAVKLALHAPLSTLARNDRWVFLSDLESRLKTDAPQFAAQHFGFSTLLHLLEQLPEDYEIDKNPGGGAVRVRPRDPARASDG